MIRSAFQPIGFCRLLVRNPYPPTPRFSTSAASSLVIFPTQQKPGCFAIYPWVMESPIVRIRGVFAGTGLMNALSETDMLFSITSADQGKNRVTLCVPPGRSNRIADEAKPSIRSESSRIPSTNRSNP